MMYDGTRSSSNLEWRVFTLPNKWDKIVQRDKMAKLGVTVLS